MKTYKQQTDGCEMNKAEIIATLRLLAADIANIGNNKAAKPTAAKLLHSESGSQGGPLVRLWNAELDKQRKATLRELIRITVYAYNGRPERLHKYAESVSALVDCVDDKARHDTKSDTAKKRIKKRPMNARGADCARLWKRDKGQTPMKTIVEDYVNKHGGSALSIMRTLNDNPDQWKDDKKATS